jgi:hypothetical protein
MRWRGWLSNVRGKALEPELRKTKAPGSMEKLGLFATAGIGWIPVQLVRR